MIGSMLLHYRIIRKLGEGGMGEVYLADDTRLKRQVALKVLPEALRTDPEGLRRFRTEAEAAARLNHPNIAQIYSIEETDGMMFITMEYVDGQPLYAHILPHDGLPLDRFFEWFLLLSDALTHAHEHGVTHRDLKPGNIMIRVDGVPKILDFGLARIKRPEPGEVDHDAPTVSMGALKSLTQRGAVLGTPAYMSPEQARGQEVDERTDLFSFGVVLYQALTGQRPFDGEDYVAIISSIVKDEPTPVTVLRAEVPRDLGRLVRKCLQKEVGNRYQTAREVRNDLKEVKADIDAGTIIVGGDTAAQQVKALAPAWLRRWPALAGVTVLFAVVVALATWLVLGRMVTPSEPPLRKFQIPVNGDIPLGDRPAISPDGTMLAYTQGGRLWIRRLDRVEPQEIPDSEGALLPFWSPQSDFVGYIAGNKLKKVSAQGGPSTTLCTLQRPWAASPSWRSAGMIVVDQGTAGLFEVSTQGGEPQLLMKPDSTRGEMAYYNPHVLPDRQSLLFTVHKKNSDWGLWNIDLVAHSGKTRQTLLHIPGEAIALPVYSPTGHIIYQRGWPRGSIWAVPFSLARLATTGDPFLVAQQAARPSVSSDGTLVYYATTGGNTQQLVWVDRNGKVEGTIGQPQEGMGAPALSLDGRQVAVVATEQDNTNTDIWVYDVARGTRVRLTVDPTGAFQPAWSPAGDRIAFSSRRSGRGDIFIQVADRISEAQPIVAGPLIEYAPNWSRDGKYLVYSVWNTSNRGDLWYLPLTGTRKPVQFLQTSFNEELPQISPDGRFVAYQSDETGRNEVYVMLFPQGGKRWPVSINGGVFPRWNGRGNELFYVEGDTLMAVTVDTRPGFQAGLPQKLFTGESVRAALNDTGYDVTADGKRFVMVQGEKGAITMTVVQNWFAEFKKAVTSDK